MGRKRKGRRRQPEAPQLMGEAAAESKVSPPARTSPPPAHCLPAVARLLRFAMIPLTDGLPSFSHSVTMSAFMCVRACTHGARHRGSTKSTNWVTVCETMESQRRPNDGGPSCLAPRCSTPLAPIALSSAALSSLPSSCTLPFSLKIYQEAGLCLSVGVSEAHCKLVAP